MRSRPPKRAWTLENTSRCATLSDVSIHLGTGLPSSRRRLTSAPRPTAPWNSFLANALFFLISALTLAKIRSHTRGGASKNVGRMVFISFGSLARLSENQRSEEHTSELQ